ncbi:MAG: class C sortase [Scrofimicrobium sp.]
MSAPSRTHRREAARRGWRFPWAAAAACLVILVGTGVFLYPQAASWFSQKEQSRVTALAQESLAIPPNNDDQYRTELLARAHQYNDALASGAVYEANANIATAAGNGAEEAFVYADLLSLTDSGVMGRLRYDRLSIDLPIYHGTSDEVLEKGVGHLEGTSLPVGGVGTRSVLTAHRGLPSATLFNELDRAKEGDTFVIEVLGQVLTYQVVEKQVIEPDQTKAILADPDRDLVTLVTCTPLGINTHRILVTAERITPTPIADLERAGAVPELPGFPWWAVILGVVMVAEGIYLWKSGLPPSRPRHHV